jgi:hypothetical protein
MNGSIADDSASQPESREEWAVVKFRGQIANQQRRKKTLDFSVQTDADLGSSALFSGVASAAFTVSNPVSEFILTAPWSSAVYTGTFIGPTSFRK